MFIEMKQSVIRNEVLLIWLTRMTIIDICCLYSSFGQSINLQEKLYSNTYHYLK